MRRLGKDFVNKAVVSMDEGRMLGRIQDLYLDPELGRVLGLYMGSEGLFKRKSLLIPREAVVVLGVDAVLVQRSDVITDDQALPEAKTWFRRDKLAGRDVDTPGGTKLGVIGDVVVEEDGAVSAFALSRVYVEGPLAESRLVDRSAVIDTGQEDGRMNVDLTALEHSLNAPAEPTADSPTADPFTTVLPPGATLSDPIQVEVEDEPKKGD
jgi:uncharacterized protein YrrD